MTTQNDMNQIADYVAAYGLSLGLPLAQCLVQYTKSEWHILTSCSCCEDHGSPKYIRQLSIPVNGTTQDQVKAAGIKLMSSLQSIFHTKH